jgi:hypothetical protein
MSKEVERLRAKKKQIYEELMEEIESRMKQMKREQEKNT